MKKLILFAAVVLSLPGLVSAAQIVPIQPSSNSATEAWAARSKVFAGLQNVSSSNLAGRILYNIQYTPELTRVEVLAEIAQLQNSAMVAYRQGLAPNPRMQQEINAAQLVLNQLGW